MAADHGHSQTAEVVRQLAQWAVVDEAVQMMVEVDHIVEQMRHNLVHQSQQNCPADTETCYQHSVPPTTHSTSLDVTQGHSN